ncbi:MAG TPA: chromosome partitioning protein ParB, partial [Actinomycetota bacterium]|nr:chromosome partitioning protein ParB [Actinomycetota bacterium]
LGLQGSPFQKRLAQRVSQEGLSVRETEDLVRRYGTMVAATSPQGSSRPARPPEITEAQRTLTDRLQTRVRVDMGARKGKIVVDFASLDELERLLGVMVGASAGPGVSTISVD